MSTTTRTRARAGAGAPVVRPIKGTSTQQQAREGNQTPIPRGEDGGPYSEVMLVTAAIAEGWLMRNTHNRPIRQSGIDDLVGILERGEWRTNDSAIAFDIHGVLQNGQHRLWAIFLTGIAVRVLVATGLTVDAQQTMDLGKRRSLKDTLVLDGHANASNLAAVLSYKWRYDRGEVRNGAVKPTIPQAKQLLADKPELVESLRTAARLKRFKVSPAMMTTALYEFASIDAEDCEVFVEKLNAGVGLEEGDPVLAMRRHLERHASSATSARASAIVTHALLIKAWNAWRDGRQVTQLTWKASGMNPEPFPEPR